MMWDTTPSATPAFCSHRQNLKMITHYKSISAIAISLKYYWMRYCVIWISYSKIPLHWNPRVTMMLVVNGDIGSCSYDNLRHHWWQSWYHDDSQVSVPNSRAVNVWLTHWGRATHMCVSKLAFICPDSGLSPGRRQAIIWTNVGILLLRTLGTNWSDILSQGCMSDINEIHTFSIKMHLKRSYGTLTHWGRDNGRHIPDDILK